MFSRGKWIYLIIIFYTAQSFSGETFEFYNGIRSLSMGGARIAVVNDETALLVNPAGLGKLRNFFATVADPEIELGSRTQAMVGADLLAFADPQAVVDFVELTPDVPFHQRIQLFPSFVVPNFGIGLYARYSMDVLSNAAGTLYDMNYRNDFGAVMGFNFRLLGGRVKIGINAKIINRAEINVDDGDATATGLTVGNMANEGFGVGSDVGVILSAPWKLLPTLAIVAHDVGGTHYNVGDGLFLNTTNRPTMEDMKVDVGFGLFPITSSRGRISLSLEVRDVLNYSTDNDLNKRSHVGFEYNLADVFFLRFGRHQQYWSGGVELAMFNYQFQLGYYGEEIGDLTTPRVDRRYVGKFSFRF